MFLLTNIILNLVAGLTGFLALICFIIGKIDDKEFITPGKIWLTFCFIAVLIKHLVLT